MSSAISRPAVPCPAMIHAWSYGGTIVSPSRSTSSTARSIRSCVVVPASSMRAPSRSAPPRLAGVTVVGITTTAFTPNRRAASATACAWLPDDGATTPRARSSALRRARKLYAPRNLNAPPRWSISGLSQISAPKRSEAASNGRSGVRTATGAMRAAAARRSSRVMRVVMLEA